MVSIFSIGSNRNTTDPRDVTEHEMKKVASSATADQLRVYRYPPTTLPQSVFFSQLTWKEAQRNVLGTIREILEDYKYRGSWFKFIKAIHRLDSLNIRFFAVENLFYLVIGFSLLSIPLPEELMSRKDILAVKSRDMKVAGALIIIFVLLNVVIVLADCKTRVTRNVKSLEIAVKSLEGCSISVEVDTPIPRSTESISLTRVVRNQKTYDCPTCLVVEGDILLIFVYETLPCNARILHRKDIRESVAENSEGQLPIFLKGEKLTIERLMEVVKCHSAYASMPLDAPCYYFRALETPVSPVMRKLLDSYSQDTIIDTQVRMFRMFSFKCLLFIILISIITTIIFAFVTMSQLVYNKPSLLFVLSLSRTILFVPHLQLPVTVLLYISRLYGNANLLSLLDGLQNSKKAFEDDTGIDEFDVAPPPTKRLGTNWLLVLKNLLSQLIQKNLSMPITRGHNMADSLAHITLLTAVDREGTITDAFPRPKQIFVVSDDQQFVSIDVPYTGEQLGQTRVELKEQSRLINSVGMAMLMSTQCHEKSCSRAILAHIKPDQLTMCGRVSPAHQVCPCYIGRLIPKLVSFADDFIHKKSFCLYEPAMSNSQNRNGVIPSAYCNLYKNASQNSFHIFTESSLLLSSEICDQYWCNESLLVLTSKLKSKIEEVYYNALNNNLCTVAYTYKSVDSSAMQLQFINDYRENILCNLLRCNTSMNLQSYNTSHQISYRDKKASRKKTAYFSKKPASFSGRDQVSKFVHNQVFLGFQTFSQALRLNMVDFIEDMRLAGIRFVYFSPYPQRESKSFAESLGLETDWNSCIVLSSVSENTPGYCDPQDISAHLPRGIENIRNHIKEVDDIPLLVPLFTEASSSSTREMIRIFQEHDEIVCCIGCSLNEENLETFSVADVSIAFSPFDKEVNQTEIDRKLVTPFEFASTIITVPCVITIKSDASIYAISQMIRDSRTLITNSRRGFLFHIGSMFSLSLVIYLSDFSIYLRPFNMSTLYWISFGLTPILAFSLIFTPHTSEVMTTIPNKRFRNINNKKRALMRFFMLFTVQMIFILGFMLTMRFISVPYRLTEYYSPESRVRNSSDPDQDSSYLFSRIISSVLWVIYTVISGLSFMFEYESFLPLSFLKNKIYCFFAMILIITHSLVAWADISKLDIKISLLEWVIFGLFAIIPSCLNVLTHTLSKRIDKRIYKITQKRRRLEIDTKLGMHSPR